MDCAPCLLPELLLPQEQLPRGSLASRQLMLMTMWPGQLALLLSVTRLVIQQAGQRQLLLMRQLLTQLLLSTATDLAAVSLNDWKQQKRC